jgi:PAS domain S-box-containing protein
LIGTLIIFDDQRDVLDRNDLADLLFLRDEILAKFRSKAQELLIRKYSVESKGFQQRLQKTNKIVHDYKSALDSAAVVSISDVAGDILYVNEKFCDITGYTYEELIGKNQRIVNSGYHSKQFWKEMWETISSGKVWSGEVCNKTKYGKVYWVETTIVPFLDENNKPYQYLSIRKEITEQKEQDDQLLHAIILSQEHAREKLSDGIHEGVAQTITALSWRIQTLSEMDHYKESSEELDQIKAILKDTIEEMRSIAHQLMPRALTTFGIVSAVETYIAQSQNEAQNITVKVEDSYNDDYSKDELFGLFRAVSHTVDLACSFDYCDGVDIQFTGDPRESIIMVLNGLALETLTEVDMKHFSNTLRQIKKSFDWNNWVLNINFRDTQSITIQLVNLKQG